MQNCLSLVRWIQIFPISATDPNPVRSNVPELFKIYLFIYLRRVTIFIRVRSCIRKQTSDFHPRHRLAPYQKICLLGQPVVIQLSLSTRLSLTNADRVGTRECEQHLTRGKERRRMEVASRPSSSGSKVI